MKTRSKRTPASSSSETSSSVPNVGLLDLGDDLMLAIASFLPATSIPSFICTCKGIATVFDSENAWQALVPHTMRMWEGVEMSIVMQMVTLARENSLAMCGVALTPQTCEAAMEFALDEWKADDFELFAEVEFDPAIHGHFVQRGPQGCWSVVMRELAELEEWYGDVMQVEIGGELRGSEAPQQAQPREQLAQEDTRTARARVMQPRVLVCCSRKEYKGADPNTMVCCQVIPSADISTPLESQFGANLASRDWFFGDTASVDWRSPMGAVRIETSNEATYRPLYVIWRQGIRLAAHWDKAVQADFKVYHSWMNLTT